MIAQANRLSVVKEYYFSRKLREIAEMQEEGKPVINIAIGSPDLEPPAEVLQALTSALSETGAHKYQSYQGIPELRSAMSSFYKRYFGVQLDFKGEILPLMGSKEGIMHISLAFLNKGDQVLVPNPGYPTYASVTELVEAEVVLYELSEENGWMPDLNALEGQDLNKVKIMWVNYPHMPTGARATRDDFKRLIEFARRNNILIVNDNPYSFIMNDSYISILEIEGARDVALELNSLSKSFNMAGWRIGMVAGKKSLIDAVLRVKSNMDSGMFYGLQKGAVCALNLPDSWMDSLNDTYSERRKLVWELFDLLGCTYDRQAGGMFVWARLPRGETSIDFTDKLLNDKYIFITPGTIFGSQGEGYIRASLCVSEQVLKEVISRIKNNV